MLQHQPSKSFEKLLGFFFCWFFLAWWRGVNKAFPVCRSERRRQTCGAQPDERLFPLQSRLRPATHECPLFAVNMPEKLLPAASLLLCKFPSAPFVLSINQ